MRKSMIAATLAALATFALSGCGMSEATTPEPPTAIEETPLYVPNPEEPERRYYVATISTKDGGSTELPFQLANTTCDKLVKLPWGKEYESISFREVTVPEELTELNEDSRVYDCVRRDTGKYGLGFDPEPAQLTLRVSMAANDKVVTTTKSVDFAREGGTLLVLGKDEMEGLLVIEQP